MKKRNIEDLLDKLNIAVDNLGYKYLIAGVEEYISNDIQSVTEIYRRIVQKYDATISRVERAIRHSCENNKETIKNYFKVDYEITNRRLIALIAREMERVKC